MERVWEDDSPHAEFIRTLMNNRVTELLSSKEWLKVLRYRHDEVKWWLKRAGHIFKERNVNLYQRIAQAHGECWDMEDEQKSAHAISQNVAPPNVKEKSRQYDAVSLGHPRQVGVRERKKEEL